MKTNLLIFNAFIHYP